MTQIKENSSKRQMALANALNRVANKYKNPAFREAAKFLKKQIQPQSKQG